MSLGPVMCDIQGVELLPEEAERLRHPAAGGVILFARNFASPEQLAELTRQIHGLRQPALLIAVDQEGGRVQRFREGFTRLPASWFGQLYKSHTTQGLRAAQRVGWLMARELRAQGVDFSFAPVLDLGRGVSEVIGDRAFSERPTVVAELSHAWAKGVHEAGMAAVGKHFPGHGSVVEDSHLALPVDDRRFEDIWMEDILPFQRMVDYGLEAVMPAHVVYRRVDERPAGFSRFWLQDVLRRRMGFQGVVFSDDLSMAAADAAGDYPARARAALEAGCDMVLVCNNPDAAAQVLDELADHNEPAAHVRMLRMHGRSSVSRADLHLDTLWQEAVRIVASYDETPPCLCSEVSIMAISAEQAAAVWSRAQPLHPQQAVENALDDMAQRISQRLSGADPLLLAIMIGGVVLAGQLLPRLRFPLRLDYIHATRYRGDTRGGELHWLQHPRESLAGQTILLVDDIVDQGITLAEIAASCRQAGAREVLSAVLVEKQHDRGNGFQADFVGLRVEDRYVFGYGMDYKDYLRNANGIYAVTEDA